VWNGSNKAIRDVCWVKVYIIKWTCWHGYDMVRDNEKTVIIKRKI
jgi:hypothetical protein